jgi:hypothetical protein
MSDGLFDHLDFVEVGFLEFVEVKRPFPPLLALDERLAAVGLRADPARPVRAGDGPCQLDSIFAVQDSRSSRPRRPASCPATEVHDSLLTLL